MPRPQFTLRSLLVAMLVVAAFFGGIFTSRGGGDFGKNKQRQRPKKLRYALW